MTTDSELRSRRDSWPPTQLRLIRSSSKEEPKPLSHDIDEDPLTYFLTPTPQLEDDDILGEAMMDFDAGIEDHHHGPDMVRSVSPSTLDGLSKPSSRARTPDFDFDMPTPSEEEDDEEDYIRFSPSDFSSRFLSLPDFAIDGRRPRPHSPLFGRSNNRPASFPGPGSPPRGRVLHTRGRHSPVRSLSARGRPHHLWREPSPDVWSIEEETEEDMAVVAKKDELAQTQSVKNCGRDGKMKKKVRFVLPSDEK